MRAPSPPRRLLRKSGRIMLASDPAPEKPPPAEKAAQPEGEGAPKKKRNRKKKTAAGGAAEPAEPRPCICCGEMGHTKAECPHNDKVRRAPPRGLGRSTCGSMA